MFSQVSQPSAKFHVLFRDPIVSSISLVLMNESSQVSSDWCHHFLCDSVPFGHFFLLRPPPSVTWSCFPSGSSALLGGVPWEADMRWSWESKRFRGYNTREGKSGCKRGQREMSDCDASHTVSAGPSGNSGATIASQRKPTFYRNGWTCTIIAQSFAGTHPRIVCLGLKIEAGL